MRARLILWLLGGESSDLIHTLLWELRNKAGAEARSFALAGCPVDRDNAMGRYTAADKLMKLFRQQDWA